MSKYYKDHYDVVIIGASLAGLSSALTLSGHGLSVLVLEQHNLPGGVATSYVRDKVEFEASLHEMMSIGSNENPLMIRQFFNEYGIDVDWIKIKDCFHLVTNDLDFVLSPGNEGDFSLPCKQIAEACEDKDGSIYNRLVSFFSLCGKIYEASNAMTLKDFSNMAIMKKFKDFLSYAGYSVKEAFEAFNLPQTAIDILSAYWVYLGSPISETPFVPYAYLLYDYIGYGSYMPKHTSYEMSLKLLEAVENRGIQVEFNQKVHKILVKNKKIDSILLNNGITISCDYLISGAYPNTVYQKMIVSDKRINKKAYKTINAMELGVSCFSLVMLLDKPYKDLNINDYATFYSDGEFNCDKQFKEGKSTSSWTFLTSVCPNVINPLASKEGTSIYSITCLPLGVAFKDMKAEEYEDYKNRIANELIAKESKRLNVDLRKHIIDLIVETPITIAHYTGAYMGSIYGYRHKMDNSVVARQQDKNKEEFVKNLFFTGAHQLNGDGMAPVINNGRKVGIDVLARAKRRKKYEN